jgi:hypothetical protein
MFLTSRCKAAVTVTARIFNIEIKPLSFRLQYYKIDIKFSKNDQTKNKNPNKNN